MIMKTKVYEIIPTFMKESFDLSIISKNELNDTSTYFDEVQPQTSLVRYETSISSLCDDESSTRGTLSSFDTSLLSLTSSAKIIYNDERSISLIAAEFSVNALLECLSKYGVQHVSITNSLSSFDKNNDNLDYLHILTMSHNHINNNIMKSKDVSKSTKKVLIDVLMNAWNNMNHFLSIQHQIAYKLYHKVRHELEVEYRILPNDHIVHPSIYVKIKRIQQQKVQKALIFLNEVSELYCSSLKGLALTKNLMIKYQCS